MEVSVHLTFDGHCEDAFRFYEEALGGEIVSLLRYGESPMANETPPEWRSKIIHANLRVGGGLIAGADVAPDQYQRPAGFYVLLSPADPQRARQLFEALADGGTVHMSLEPTFWSPAFGVVTDRFGVPWEISCEGPSANASGPP